MHDLRPAPRQLGSGTAYVGHDRSLPANGRFQALDRAQRYLQPDLSTPTPRRRGPPRRRLTHRHYTPCAPREWRVSLGRFPDLSLGGNRVPSFPQRSSAGAPAWRPDRAPSPQHITGQVCRDGRIITRLLISSVPARGSACGTDGNRVAPPQRTRHRLPRTTPRLHLTRLKPQPAQKT